MEVGGGQQQLEARKILKDIKNSLMGADYSLNYEAGFRDNSGGSADFDLGGKKTRRQERVLE